MGIATPRGADILIVAVLGALGGALAATLSIRNLKGTSTPYDVPVALAALKVPMGALTAILGLVAIQGEFIPGLSELDSQGQILAYALVFGFAQQALSRLLDQQAQSLLEGLPGGTNVAPAPSAHDSLAPAGGGTLAPTAPPAHPGPGPVDGGDEETDDEMVPAVSAAADRPTEEPESATQQDQLNLLEDTGNDRQDMTEDEEAELLEAEFGPPDDDGIYGAPPAAPDPPGRAPAGAAPGGP